MASALEVANLFLFWANRDGDVITNLKMQKLLYYAQAWHLVNYGSPLFPDQIEAWDLGPVIRSVYRAFKSHRASPIDYSDKKGREEARFSGRDLTYLREFYRNFIKLTAHELVEMSHNETPWQEAHASHQSIDNSAMKKFYSHLYEQSHRKAK